ncbi:MAG: alanine dehydrogenase, partial [Candidatus Oceanisphaera merdipullorum]|nr:alanine dehydrogenase [Candidatus Oceanisphaera merdipullorum]
TYEVDGVVHYCVANMPGAVAYTSTFALINTTLPYVKALANLGWKTAMQNDPLLAQGLNVHQGQVICPAVAEAHGLSYTPLQQVLTAG